ncbi:hypothetical protein RIF29_00035 [Crotalaria pallida]|uniref:RING-type E3 ubiquitin transferase n=1 Tax=Crotalaria pallida TaxID=3830 RepID=A0AAN9IVH0_CROPI
MSESTLGVHVDSDSVQVAVCSLCQKALSPDNDVTSDLPTNGVCSDCKFLLLEDFGNHHTATQITRRRHRGRRVRHNSSESVENILSQQLSYMVNNARQNQSISSLEEDDQVVDGAATAWSLHYANTHAAPSGSRNWRRVLSDTDSDGFDNWGSLYGESESNVSFRRYGVPHGDTDSFSFSAYGGDSDISVDRHSFVGTDMFNLADEGDELDSDTDIDPMHAGLDQWNSHDIEDNEEEEEDEEDDEEEEEEVEWELAEVEEAEVTARLQSIFTSSLSESGGGINWEQRFNSTVEGIYSERIRDSWRAAYNNRSFTNLDDAELPPYRANFGDYLDARNFEDLLEHLAENDNSRRGAPPAAVSFVDNLPLVVIGKEHEKHDGEELVCAICKDVLAPGTKVNQLPCSHLYHTCCILPWLTARNSCPLCRYELPTDDKDYEEGKQYSSGRNLIHERQQPAVMNDDSSADASDGAEMNEEDGGTANQGGRRQPREPLSSSSSLNSSATRGGRRWFFLAAAPIVSLVGIVLVLWLGNNNPQNQIEGTINLGGRNISAQNHHHAHHVYASANQRESRSRRWWCPF